MQFILNVFLSILFLLVLNSFLYYANYIQNGKHEFKYSAAAKPDIYVLTYLYNLLHPPGGCKDI